MSVRSTERSGRAATSPRLDAVRTKLSRSEFGRDRPGISRRMRSSLARAGHGVPPRSMSRSLCWRKTASDRADRTGAESIATHGPWPRTPMRHRGAVTWPSGPFPHLARFGGSGPSSSVRRRSGGSEGVNIVALEAVCSIPILHLLNLYCRPARFRRRSYDEPKRQEGKRIGCGRRTDYQVNLKDRARKQGLSTKRSITDVAPRQRWPRSTHMQPS